MSAIDVERYWDEWETVAAHRDARIKAARPMLSDLVKAARRTTLFRLFPFFTHDVLRFGSTPAWEDGPVAPVFVVFNPAEGYVVFKGDLIREVSTTVLTTPQAGEAIRTIERLLIGWPDTANDG